MLRNTMFYKGVSSFPGAVFGTQPGLAGAFSGSAGHREGGRIRDLENRTGGHKNVLGIHFSHFPRLAGVKIKTYGVFFSGLLQYGSCQIPRHGIVQIPKVREDIAMISSKLPDS